MGYQLANGVVHGDAIRGIMHTPQPRRRHAVRLRPAPLLAALAVTLVALATVLAGPVTADHPTPPCFDEHAGIHSFPLTAGASELVIVAGPLAGTTVKLALVGPTLVDARVTSATRMETQILEMDLLGFHPAVGPVEVRVDPVVPSLGEVNAFSATQCYPASSSFDVMVQVVAPFPAHAHVAKHMTAQLQSIPPEGGEFYEDAQPIALYAGPAHVGPPAPSEPLVAYLQGASHTPTPECMDGMDNDGDALADYPADPDCQALWDPSEQAGNNTALFPAAADWTPVGWTPALSLALLFGAGLVLAAGRRR